MVKMGLKEQRKKKGYTAFQLGAITGISYRTIQNIEFSPDKINRCELKTLCKLAIALDCTIFDLIEDKELKSALKLALKEKNTLS